MSQIPLLSPLIKPKTFKRNYKLLVTGSTGLVGSQFVDILESRFSIKTCGRKNTDVFADLLSEKKIKQLVESSDCQLVINFAAYTNVDGAEAEKKDKTGEVYTLNALLPLWLTQACISSGKKFFHISTDYVFDGKKDIRPYTEEDTPKPINSWYALTKCYGEENILNYPDNKTTCTIVRISYPYSGLYRQKLDIARSVVKRLENKELYFGIENQKIKPTSVDDIAEALAFLIERGETGIFHVAGNYCPNEFITPLQFAKKIAWVMNLDSSLIKSTLFLELSKKRLAARPQNTWLSTKKIESLGFKITHIDQALARFKKQLKV